MSVPRWLFHVARAGEVTWDARGRYAPASLSSEGFVHASYKGDALESARLYFPATAALTVLAMDPRRLDVPVEVAATPRGPMPHVVGSIPRDATREIALADVPSHADEARGARVAFVAFPGMTLLDLVGPLDAVSRLTSMGFDPACRCEVVSMATDGDGRVFAASGLEVRATRHRPPLDAYDVAVVAGGPGTRGLEVDAEAIAWLAAFPDNRLLASVCTGALLLGAAGRLRGRRATTHHTARGELARFGATLAPGRVVDDGQIVTAAGVTSGLDLGLTLVRRLAGDDVAARVAEQMEMKEA